MNSKPVSFCDNDFHKSSYSNGGTDCVEVAQKEGVIAVRNSKDVSKNTVFFNKSEWNAFVAGVKNNEFLS
ncbi:MAG: hypothetical protein RLZZ230_359 [Candidatus Parcubacteria bacterium]|jgi:hypothetical protein